MKDPRIGKLYIYHGAFDGYHGAFDGRPSISIITGHYKEARYGLYRLGGDPYVTVTIKEFTHENATEIHYERRGPA